VPQGPDSQPAKVPRPFPPYRPSIACIEDAPDRPGKSLGPAGFHRQSLRQLFDFADIAVLATCVGWLKASENAAAFAAQGLSVVLVETSSEAMPAWRRFVRRHLGDFDMLIAVSPR
jgi:hypothetical protein